jgi:hypothetical protein
MYRAKLTLIAATMLLAGIGPAGAAQENKGEQKMQESDQIAGKSAESEKDYLAAVKNCEGFGAKEKQQCIEAAKERFGEMLR